MKIHQVSLFVSLLLITFGCKEEPLCDFPENMIAPMGFKITELAKINNSSEYFHLQFMDNENGVMLGDENTLLKTNDGGHSWTKTPITDSLQINVLRFVDSLNGYVSFYSEKKALLAKTIDAGQSWETIEYPFDGNISQILVDGDILYAILENKNQYKLLKSIDRANTWKEINDFPFQYSSLSKIKDDNIYIVAYSNIIVCNTSGHLLKKIDISISLISSLYVFDDKTLIIGNNSKILKSENFGDSWTDISPKKSQQIIHFFDKENGIVLTSEDCSLSDFFIVAYSIDKTSTGGDQWLSGETFNPSNYSLEVVVALKNQDHIVILEEKNGNQIVLHEIQKK